MITRIVVPVSDSDLSERALPVAAALARVTGARLHLVEAEPLGRNTGAADERLQAVARSVGSDIAVSTGVEITTASVGRALGALELAAGDVVCMATHGPGVVRQLLFGSVTEAVVRRSSAPVLVVGPHCTTGEPADLRRPAVVALSGPAADREVLVTAAAWARATGAPIRGVHVVIAPSEERSWARADAVVASARDEAHRLGFELATEIVAATDVDRGLERAAADAGCIVTGSRRHGVVGRFVLGSTVSSLAHHAECPVLVAGPLADDGSTAANVEEVDHGSHR